MENQNKTQRVTRRIAIGIEELEGQEMSVSLKGTSENADYIIKLAHRYNIPVVKSPKIVKLLNELPDGAVLPKELIPPLEAVLEGID